MNTPTRKGTFTWSTIAIILILTGLTLVIVLLIASPMQVAALAADPIVAGCGTATMDGVIDPVEWSWATAPTACAWARPTPAWDRCTSSRCGAFTDITKMDASSSSICRHSGMSTSPGDEVRLIPNKQGLRL